MNNAERQWERFHSANPEFYQRLRDLAVQVRATGHRRYTIAMLFERLRVNGWSAPNATRAYYSRLLMKEHPEMNGFFRIASFRSRTQEYRNGYRRAILDAAALVDSADEAENIRSLLVAHDVYDGPHRAPPQ